VAAVTLLAAVAPPGLLGACRGSRQEAAVAAPAAPAAGKAPAAKKRRLPRIDVHTHIGPDGIERALALMDQWGIDGVINLSGMYPGPPRQMLETQLEAAAQARGRIAVFTTVDFVRAVRFSKDYGATLAAQLEEAKQKGARGLKISKGLGLGLPAPGLKSLLAVDDPGLDPLFEKAGELGMPVAIHTGDPKAFWKPADEKNERIDELRAHPDWSFFGEEVPSWEALYKAFERRVARHPKTTFIGVHFGNAPEDPDLVARMLDKHPNLYIDTAARVPEIGRHDADKMKRFFEKYQDRVLLGTDTGIGGTQEDMMYGSNGADPPTIKDEERFFSATWRYFETRDKQFEHPTPIQGRWKIDGVGLSEAVLRKIYFENAARLIKWKPPVAPEAR
jgi:predicted TIM-barrel fold metal-dependent hydrolase